MDGFSISMLDEYDSLCEEASPFLTSASTQTAGEQPARKIKPIRHPALKLKSPIAYQKDTDLSVIPIQRDGMGKLLAGPTVPMHAAAPSVVGRPETVHLMSKWKSTERCVKFWIV
jgi:hypothetical protein